MVKTLIEELKGQRETLIKKAGVIAKGKLETELAALKDLHANGLRIRIETTDQGEGRRWRSSLNGTERDLDKREEVQDQVGREGRPS